MSKNIKYRLAHKWWEKSERWHQNVTETVAGDCLSIYSSQWRSNNQYKWEDKHIIKHWWCMFEYKLHLKENKFYTEAVQNWIQPPLTLLLTLQKCPSLGLLVCQQDYTKTAEWISMKLGWRLGLDPEQSPLTFVVDLKFFFHDWINFFRNNSWILKKQICSIPLIDI